MSVDGTDGQPIELGHSKLTVEKRGPTAWVRIDRPDTTEVIEEVPPETVAALEEVRENE